MNRCDLRHFMGTWFIGLVALAGCSSLGGGGGSSPALLPDSVRPNDGAAHDKRGTIKFFIDDYADPVPSGIAAGPDGALWFTDTGNDTIGRMTTHGSFTFYQTGVELSTGITAGPDGALWFTTAQYDPNAFIGRITTNGTLTLFNDPTGYFPQGITTGPDGALWFGESNGTIGRITTQGSVTHFKVGPEKAEITSIVTGADGALWAIQTGNYVPGKVIRLKTSGKVKSYKVSGAPEYICVGPDKALWFTEFADEIGRMTTDGKLSQFPIKRGSSAIAEGIASGSDGALWFAFDSSGSAAIGRMTTAGKVRLYKFAGGSDPVLLQLTSGPLGDVWFTSAGEPTGIGRITTR